MPPPNQDGRKHPIFDKRLERAFQTGNSYPDGPEIRSTAHLQVESLVNATNWPLTQRRSLSMR